MATTRLDLQMLTAQQAAVLRFIYDLVRDRGYQPSYHEICDHFGFSGPNGVFCHLLALKRKGWIAPTPGTHGRQTGRALRLLRRPDGLSFTGFADKLTPKTAAWRDPQTLTAQQAAVLDCLYRELRDQGHQPAYRDICARFGFRNVNSVTGHFRRLARAGWLELGVDAERKFACRAVRLLYRPDGFPFTGFADKPALETGS